MKSTFFFGVTQNFCEITKDFNNNFLFSIMTKPDMKSLNFTLNESQLKNFQLLILNNQTGYVLDQNFSIVVGKLKVKYEITISYINQSELNVRLNAENEQEYMNIKIDESFKTEILKLV